MADSAQEPLAGSAAAGLRIVALGASAGGLEPLVQLLAQVPTDSGLAWIVAQHLDPDRPSLLAGLLQRATTMPVQEARQSMLIEPDHVYVMPPHAELTVADGRLHLAEPSQPRGQRLLIDRLFESLAQAQGAGAVGVLLSGMGADGSLGLQAIRARGGLTLAQRPGTAQFDAMPRHAIAAGGVAIVALPAEMPARILASAAGTSTPPLTAAPLAGEASAGDMPEAGVLQAILALLQAHTGHDLTHHKPSSLLRRISRRMAVHGLATLPAYADLLRANPQALELLFKELLIGVTGFFRDPEAWQVLADTVLPALLARRSAGAGPLRAWVAGCSTGEEAYTLAMLLTEALDAEPAGGGGKLQVFATDLSADAIAAARSGLFPAAIAQAMTPQRLARFFTAQGGRWRISAA